MFKFFYSKKGFTLTELLICVIILSILAGVAVPIFDKKQKKQKMNDCENNCKVIETAVKEAMYGMMDNGKKQEYYVGGSCNQTSSSEYMFVGSSWKYKDVLTLFVYKSGIYKGDAEYINNTKIAEYNKMCVIDFEFSLKCMTNKYADSSVSTLYSSSIGQVDNGATTQRVGYVHVPGTSTDFKDYQYKNTALSVYAKKIYGSYATTMGSTFSLVISPNDAQCMTLGQLRGFHRSSSSDAKIRAMSYNDACEYGYYLKKANMADIPFYKFLPNEEVPICPFDKEGNGYYCVFMDGTVMCMCPQCLALKSANTEICKRHNPQLW